MSQTPFSAPVYLKLHSTGDFQARTPAEALQYLDLHWPGTRAAHYRRARSLCQAAIDGQVDVETARVAVVDAATKAGLIGKRWEVDGQPVNTVCISTGVYRKDDLLEVNDSDFIGYFCARDIVDDPSLSPSRKKAMLAYWASDRHAVSGMPSLRNVRGVTVTIDSLFKAMDQIDSEIDPGAMRRGSTNSEQPW